MDQEERKMLRRLLRAVRTGAQAASFQSCCSLLNEWVKRKTNTNHHVFFWWLLAWLQPIAATSSCLNLWKPIQGGTKKSIWTKLVSRSTLPDTDWCWHNTKAASGCVWFFVSSAKFFVEKPQNFTHRKWYNLHVTFPSWIPFSSSFFLFSATNHCIQTSHLYENTAPEFSLVFRLHVLQGKASIIRGLIFVALIKHWILRGEYQYPCY